MRKGEITMTVREVIKLIPNGTTLFISTEICHPDVELPFIETCEETYKVGSYNRIPAANLEVEMIGSMGIQQIHIRTESMYV